MTAGLHRVEDAAEGLALEVRLFEASEPCVALWHATSPALVCPAAYGRREGFVSAALRSRARGWPVLTRPTGGGAVPQGAGVLNLAMATTVDRGFSNEDGYRLITFPIQSVGARFGLRIETGTTEGSFCDGTWNLSCNGRKLVGTAQRWRPLADGRAHILAHALILTHGPVAAETVDAFHTDLGLGPVRREAHTTFEEELGPQGPELDDLAVALKTAARHALAEAGPRVAANLAA
ncbi:hypothetical protein R3X27_24575 [Tropicimonas sp. TH_r6]|uniref:lipoyl protein ligase domain-containing protein n=1 Tax=Tropicimonas sp. TH_r6 TaxID=3082085 RepID=UPI0029534524|nr:hypothetical protein [Tropicimonas sp. TH_r6]MDV7145867.1 hypothetical protein [Tropicimonas sp. TH_r6]